MNRERNDTCFSLTASACIPDQVVMPGTSTSGNLPAFLLLSIGSDQVVSRVPADDKTKTVIECQSCPGTASKAAIPDVDDLPTPSVCHFSQDFAFQLSFFAGFLAACGPPSQVGQHRSTLQTCDQQLQPIEARHKDRTPAGRIEITWLDPLQTGCFCGTHCT